MDNASTISKDRDKALKILQEGGLVAIPTETVYGLGADASNASAVKKIFVAKGRPKNHPLIVHIESHKQLHHWAKEIPDAAYKLAAAFWPGALTLILQKKEHVLEELTGGFDSIALRAPNHPLALELLRAFGGGIAAPSANLYGQVSPTSAQDVYEELGESVDLILDGGRCHIGIESTIVDLSQGDAKVLRPGAITQEQINAVLKSELTTTSSAKTRAQTPHSGDKPSHYAPKARVILANEENLQELLEEWQDRSNKIGILLPKVPKNADKDLTWLAFGEDAQTQAHRLYSSLRKADHLKLDVLLVLLPKARASKGIALAIEERLKRASQRK